MLTKLSNENIKELSSNSICELIIFCRNVTKNYELIENLMKELSFRRQNGDNFNFESKLKEISKEIDEIRNQLIFDEGQIE